MANSKYTPGPWGIFVGLSDGPRRYIGYSNREDANGACPSIAWMDRHHPDSEANAGLIAAAPELLEALKRVRDRFFPADQIEPSQDLDWNLVNSAIKKAEGE